MPPNREIYQCAKLLIDKYGADGAIDHCDKRILDQRDPDGAEVWKGIRIAVKHLLEGMPILIVLFDSITRKQLSVFVGFHTESSIHEDFQIMNQ